MQMTAGDSLMLKEIRGKWIDYIPGWKEGEIEWQIHRRKVVGYHGASCITWGLVWPETLSCWGNSNYDISGIQRESWWLKHLQAECQESQGWVRSNDGYLIRIYMDLCGENGPTSHAFVEWPGADVAGRLRENGVTNHPQQLLGILFS